MIHKNLSALQYGYKLTSRKPPQAQMSVVVRGTWRLRPGEPLSLIEDPLEQDFLTADVVPDEDFERVGPVRFPSDFADWKPCAEVMLRGTAYVPGGGSDTTVAVKVAVGGWSKSLVVVGPRVWKPGLLFGASASDPLPFESMPLTWENAFGGEGFAANPVGRGLAEELPLVEVPGDMVRKKSQRPIPATYLPVNPLWAPRKGKEGRKYGAKWRKERAPFYAEDFDWSYFNAAYPDQWIEGYLRGDEQVSLQNLNPELPLWEFQLPGVRVRHFVRDVEGQEREVPMVCDTLFIDLERGRLHLSWRGLVDVREHDFSDLPTALSALEPLGEARPAEDYLEQLRAVESDPLNLSELLPPELYPAFIAANLAEINLSRELVNLPPMAAPPPAPTTLPAPDNPVSGLLREKLGGAQPQEQLRIQEALGKARARYEAAPPVKGKPRPSFDELLASTMGGSPAAFPIPIPGAPPKPGVKPPIDLSAFGKAIAKAKEKLKGSGQDVDLSTLEEAEEQAQEATAELGGILGPTPGEPGEDFSGQDLSGQDFSGRTLVGADFSDAILSRANFSGATLTGATFSRARLDEANFSRAQLEQAVFAQAEAPSASFAGAKLQNAQLPEANLRGACLAGADLRAAQLPQAVLSDADLSRVDLSLGNLQGAKLERAKLVEARFDMGNFVGAVMPAADLSQAQAEMALLSDCDFRGGKAREARLVRCDFQRALVSDADFTQATLEWSSFRNVQGQRIRFVGAKMHMFCASRRADFTDAVITGVEGPESIWLNATLTGADFSYSNLRSAQLQGARAAGTRFDCVDFKEAGMRGIQARGARFVQANLCTAMLMLADLRGADLAGANCYETVFIDAQLEDSNQEGARMKHALLEQRS